MPKIIWLSDIHLNHISETNNRVILNHVVGKLEKDNTVVITGDIAEAPSVLSFMSVWRKKIEEVGANLKFVLGNHDYYRGSINNMRKSLEDLFTDNWLGSCGIVNLNDTTALVGHDGWYDGLYSDYFKSRLDMNDYYLIKELSCMPPANISKMARFGIIQNLSGQSANYVYENGKKALLGKYNTLYIATHIPPYVNSAWFKGAPSNSDWLPHFSSKLMGDAITKLSQEFPDKKIIVLCGHTHVGEPKNHEYLHTDNCKCYTASAEYGLPVISDIFKL